MIKSPLMYIVISVIIIIVAVSYMFNWGIMDLMSISFISFITASLAVFMYDWGISDYVCDGVCYY